MFKGIKKSGITTTTTTTTSVVIIIVSCLQFAEIVAVFYQPYQQPNYCCFKSRDTWYEYP